MAIDVIIETPSESRTKYAWDKKHERFRAGKLLPLGMTFPFDFGFIPKTKGGDGDELDVLVLADAPLAVGCIVEVNIHGAIRAKTSDKESKKLERNDRVIVVPTETQRGVDWKDLNDIGEALIDSIEGFLRSYVERDGRQFELDGRLGRAAAEKLVEDAR